MVVVKIPFMKAPANPAKISPPMQPAPEPSRLEEKEVGWRIATFAGDCLFDDAEGWATITAIWGAYQRWCAEGGKAPLAYPVFVEEFGAVAAAAGMPRRQLGGNVVFPTVAVRGEE